MFIYCDTFEIMMQVVRILAESGYTFIADTATLKIKLTGGW